MLTSTPRLLFRNLEPGDERFRLQLFVTSREREFSALPDEIRSRLAMQQYESYLSGIRASHPEAQHLVFSLPDAAHPAPAAGMISLAECGDHLLVIDMAVLPHFRNRGIGALVLEAVMDMCRKTGQVMRGSVTPYNPARRLYARIGIKELDADHAYIPLEWHPEQPFLPQPISSASGSAAAKGDTRRQGVPQPPLKNP